MQGKFGFMTLHDANNWKTLAMLYERTFELYISLSSKIQDDMFPEIVKIFNETMDNADTSQEIKQIQETTKEIHKKVFEIAEQYGNMKLDAYETAGQKYEKVGDLQNAAEIYMHSYDYCQDKSVELFDEIARKPHTNDKTNVENTSKRHKYE